MKSKYDKLLDDSGDDERVPSNLYSFVPFNNPIDDKYFNKDDRKRKAEDLFENSLELTNEEINSKAIEMFPNQSLKKQHYSAAKLELNNSKKRKFRELAETEQYLLFHKDMMTKYIFLLISNKFYLKF